MGKTFFVYPGWQMIYPKSKGVSKLLPFFFAVNIVLFSLFLGVMEKVGLTG